MTRAADFAAWFGPDAFDATYGYDLAALRGVRPCPTPPGFAEHWRARYQRARAVHGTMRRAALGPVGAHELYRIDFPGTDDRRLGGWLALPRDGRVHRGVVQSHGYGGRSGPEPGILSPGTAVLWPVARGLPTASLMPDLPALAAEHVLVGIDSVDSYILGGCAEDIWCAATALRDAVGQVPLHFVGESFGGGIGALALPWDDRFVSGVLRVPSFGQYDLRLQMPCTGSGEAVRSHVAAHPGARAVLAFFDASTAATFLDVPMLLGCALWDPAVPPPGQFGVRNAIDGAEEFVSDAGHAEYPGEAEQLAAWQRRVHGFIDEVDRIAAP
ncbi:acetylxylan esterase [Pseudactinotalea sp. Z1739]|uniref:acetylxylan esterase n=1 Tax=Pseudactinotalea sp. Z1739 TaxID=3413028 RepID=UPI003C7DD3A7